MSQSADKTVQQMLDTTTPKHEHVSQVYALIDDLKLCMFTTLNPQNQLVSRCMRLQHRSNMDFWFITSKDARKVDDLHHSHQVNLAFLDVSKGQWVSVSGTANVIRDVEKNKELYSEDLKTWFVDLRDNLHDGGPEDPRMLLVRVRANTIQYAFHSETQSTAEQLMETVKGALVGKSLSSQPATLRVLSAEDVNAARTLSQ